MTTLPRHFVPDASPVLPSAERMGLRVFMAVVTALFSLLILAYAMRMREADWMPVPHPMLLWWNTGVLALASAAMEVARRARMHHATRRTIWLLAGGALAALFVFGQWMAWQQLSASGQGVAINPSNSFLYVFTGLHAAHVIGGLIVLAVTIARLRSDPERAHRAATLCATYWHFLLAVWLVLLAAMWWITPAFVAAICGPLYGATP
ncbi:cytochrome c oxidase subunit 3 [Ralstonia sp. R-29]|uniref:cytochrome c oxidase subunit 3 n=1 Tax=Ralstonia sp. R-29 TaxID=3404059 RepID=UPI003CE91771